MEGDSLKALPTSRVAEALRRYQELAVLAAGDPSRPLFMRGVASVADALIGRAPEGLDDIASGMARLRRPAQHESWVGANEPLLDAAGLSPLAPGSGASKAVLMGGKMLRAVGRGRAFREASEHLLDTGDAPLGWIKHPGTPRTHTGSLMKYEPMKLRLDVAKSDIFGKSPALDVTREAAYYFEPNDFIDAFARTTGNRLKIVPKSSKSRGLGSFFPADGEVHVGMRTLLRPSGTPEAEIDLGLRDLFGHELAHAGQSASGLVKNQRGGTPRMWEALSAKDLPDPRELQVASDLPMDAAAEIIRRRMAASESRGTPFQQYWDNPGEKVAQTMGGLASKEGLAGGWTPTRRNYERRQAMLAAERESRTTPTVEDIFEEARILQKQLEARRAARKATP